MSSHVYVDYGDRGWEGVQLGIDGDIQIVHQTLTASSEREACWSLQAAGTQRLREVLAAGPDDDLVEAIARNFSDLNAFREFLTDNHIDLGDPWIHTDNY